MLFRSDAPGMKNQIEQGVNGIIVPTGDSDEVANAIEKLMNSKDMRIKFSRNLKCHLENSNIDIKRSLELFDKITG